MVIFLELHTPKGEVLTVNLLSVLFLCPSKRGTTLMFADGLAEEVTESYEILAVKLRDCTCSDLKV